jgi:4,5-DOPA dioxygenase extradiol
MQLPAIFVSHGAPTLAIDRDPTHEFLRGLGPSLGTPKAILCVSAHWEARVPTVSLSPGPPTIHDFYGFPRELYDLRYPAPGAPEVANRTLELLKSDGWETAADSKRGLDHGAWVPLLLMYPEAQIPVTQLSVQTHLGAAAHLKMGRALAPLRKEGVLLLGSGGAVHNLALFGMDQTPAWAAGFDEWLNEKILSGAEDELAHYRTRNPDALTAHPTEEHFLPLFVAMGAGGLAGVSRLHHGFTYGSIGMAAYSFGR